jgi:Putative SAM-dependent methyltransferase
MAITFFELLNTVIEKETDFISNQLEIPIDAVYELILDEAERNQVEWFSDRVPNLNYQDPACRLAYLYIVAAANASTFQHVLESNEDLHNYVLKIAKERHEVKICAFGAGPGTELMAMAKFFEQQKLGVSVSVDFQLLDKVQEWASSWYGIRDQVNESFKHLHGANRSTWPMIPSGNFLACDVTELDRFSYLGDVWKQDIYVLNFLLSEIFHDDPGLRSFLSQVAKFAPTGARFVFIERRGYRWQQHIQNIAKESGLVLSKFIESPNGRLVGEDATKLGQIYDAIQERRKPRLTWNVVYSIGVKQ